MSDEIISEILNLNNQDETIRNGATESLMTRISSPQFLEFLLQLIIDTKIQSQQNLFIQTLIVLKECIKYNYLNCETSDNNFTKILPNGLIQILDSIPTQYHSYIIDYFRQINDITFKRSPKATLNNFLNSIQISTIPFILEQLKEQKNFITNLFILKIFIKFYIREDTQSQNIEFFTQIFHETIPMFVEIITSQEINEFTASSVRIFLQILNNCVYTGAPYKCPMGLMNETIDTNHVPFKMTDYFNPQGAINIITNLSNFYNYNFEYTKSLNHNLLRLSMIFNLLYSHDTEYVSTIFPLLFNILTRLLIEMDSKSWDIFTRYYSLKIIQYIYDSKLFNDEINSVDFLTRILIPSAKLTESDLNDLTTIPDLIQSYFLMKEEENDDINLVFNYSVRKICSIFAIDLLQIPELHSIVLEPTEDPIEFESRIFLLSKVYSISKLIPPEYIQFIIEFATTNFQSNPPFLQASFIYFLCHHINLISDCSTLSQFSVFCINNSTDPMIIIASVDLLRNQRLVFKSIENIEEKNSIIPKLLEFCNSFNYWEPLDVIVKLFKEESYEKKEGIGEFLYEILSALFENCFSIVSKSTTNSEFEDMNMNGLGEIFDNIIDIINDDDLLSDEVISFCLQKCSLILKEIHSFFNINYWEPLFKFVSFFNYLLKNPIQDQFDFIMFTLSTNNYYAPFILVAVYPLILNPQSDITKREEFIQTIAEICQLYISKIMSGDISTIVVIESLLRVSGALIEIFGESFINFVEFAFFILQNDFLSQEINEKYFTHLIYLLYNSYKANPLLIISKIDNKTIHYILNFSISSISYNEYFKDNEKGIYFRDEINCHLFLLLEFAKKGKQVGAPEILALNSENFFRKALEVAKSLSTAIDIHIYKCYNIKSFWPLLALRYFPTSVEKLNEWDYLKNVAEEAGFELSELDIGRINLIIETIQNYKKEIFERFQNDFE